MNIEFEDIQKLSKHRKYVVHFKNILVKVDSFIFVYTHFRKGGFFCKGELFPQEWITLAVFDNTFWNFLFSMLFNFVHSLAFNIFLLERH